VECLKDGEREHRTEWHRITRWGKLPTTPLPLRRGTDPRRGRKRRYEPKARRDTLTKSEATGGHFNQSRSREYETDSTKVRTYDIVASAIVNLRAGQRTSAPAPEPEEAAA
jgi:hypothetical protein